MAGWPVRQCQRFRADGSRCPHLTDYADGWCRQPDCPGFRRRNIEIAPETFGAPRGSAKHVQNSADVEELRSVEAFRIRVTTRAVDSFRYHHGGGIDEAQAELRSMVEDFLLCSACEVAETGGYVLLSRDGYTLVLAPNLHVITAYSTVHRERTWAQVKAGVPSRIAGKFRKPGSRRSMRPASGEEPEPGPAIDSGAFWQLFDPAQAHLTGRVRTSYARMENAMTAADEDLDCALRTALHNLPGHAALTQREDGKFELVAAGRVWLVSPDARTLIGVKPDRSLSEPETEVPGQDGGAWAASPSPTAER